MKAEVYNLIRFNDWALPLRIMLKFKKYPYTKCSEKFTIWFELQILFLGLSFFIKTNRSKNED